MNNKILVIGSAGFLGNNLLKHLKPLGEVLGGVHNTEFAEWEGEGAIIDIRKPTSIETVVYHFKPKVIINCASLSSAVECEKYPEKAYQLNVVGARNVARVAQKNRIRLFYLSSDMVFDGIKGNYSEEDDPKPMTVYARTKLEGEKAVLSIDLKTVVIRSALLFGVPLGKASSFSDWLEKSLVKKTKIHLFKNQFRTPLYVEDMCRAIAKIVDRKNLAGIFHIGGDEKIDRVAFAQQYAKIRGHSLENAKPVELKDVKSNYYLHPDLSLNNQKIKKAINFKPWSLNKSITEIDKVYREKKYAVLQKA